MATSGHNRRLEPSYKQHAVVDDERGVVLDVKVTTGEANEGDHLLGPLGRAAGLTGGTASMVTADAGYAYAKVFAGLEDRNVTAVIPAKAEPIRSKVPLRRFRYDARNDTLKCPRNKVLRPKKTKIAHGRFFGSKVRDCKGCDLAALCLSPSRAAKAVVIVVSGSGSRSHNPNLYRRPAMAAQRRPGRALRYAEASARGFLILHHPGRYPGKPGAVHHNEARIPQNRAA